MDPAAFAECVAADVVEILGSDLVGVYLHGSLALRSFNPQKSDVDFVVVTEREMDDATRRQLAELFLRRSRDPYPLEVTVVEAAVLQQWKYPTPFEFHYSESWRERMERALEHDAFKLEPGPPRTTTDLAVEVTIVRERGKRLRGAHPADVFPPVPEGDLLDSMLKDLAWARSKPKPVYGVLNACRALAHLAGKKALSKAEAARWARAELAPEHVPVIGEALETYEGGGDEPADLSGAWSLVTSAEQALEARNS